MTMLTKMIRSTPVPALKDFFENRYEDLPANLNWAGTDQEITSSLLNAIENMTEEGRLRVVNDAERVKIGRAHV